VVLTIRNADGEEIDRQVMGVGALFNGEERSFTLEVEAVEVRGYRARRKH